MQIADFHCDLLSYLARGKGHTAYDLVARAAIPQLQQGGVALQTMAIFTETKKGSATSGMRQAEEFFKLKCEGIKTVLAVENGSSFCAEDEPLEVGLKRVEEWWRRAGKMGYISLTWNGENRFGGGCGAKVGLKADGKELLSWMDGKKIAIDLSHTSDRLAEEILQEIEGCDIRVVASHSNFRAVADQVRNLPDAIAKEIGARGGVIGLNFVRIFLGVDGPQDFLKQAEHAEKLGLLDHWCFGADFFEDHEVPPELSYMIPFFHPKFEDASCYPRLIELLSKYLSREIVGKIAYHNLAQFLGMS
jgi:membrane dipeptidase